jgi:glycyl-tRNA synthetase beta chain
MVRVPAPNMAELLLELLSEEIPARMQRRAIEDLTGLLRDKLVAAEIPAANLRGYVTPRRLAVIAKGIPSTQPDRTEERRGPRVGAPPQAIDGFLRSVGLADSGECEIRDTGRGEFYFAVIKRSGRPAVEVLPDLIKTAIAELPWPKSMRWPGSPLRWVRPLTTIICVFEGEILPLAIDGVSVGRTTCGHRFLSPEVICVSNGAEYVDQLQRAYVIVDHDRRKEMIRADLDRRAAELGVAVKPDAGLLDEVTGLAEFPVVLAGAIDVDLMSLPSEVLQTAMRVHQKYFSCTYPDGRPAPHFLFVANNLAEDGGKAIIAGNERVLCARLADARFFWDQDRKVKLSSRIEGLSDRIFHAKLGSLHDKLSRMDLLADFLIPLAEVYDLKANDELARRAIFLSKADLSTGMVGEFPELQGIIGRYYALHDREDSRVANAILDHYKPLGPKDICPRAPESIVVALADKIDTLAAFFAIDEKPTGSRDPFALRRAALGVIRIIIENSLRIPLYDCLLTASKILTEVNHVSESINPKVIANDLLNFTLERLHIHLRGEGFGNDVIAAALYAGDLPADPPERTKNRMEQDMTRLVRRADALQRFLLSDDGATLLTAYHRAANIVAIEHRRGGWAEGEIDSALLCQPEETALADRLQELFVEFSTPLGHALEREDFEEAMSELARLREPIDEFFNKVTVNTDNENLRENRLRLLARIRDTMNRVADFSQIEG